jgi:YjjG family noncanonical pyrimidine nucleotidase
MFRDIQYIYFDLDDTLMDFTYASRNAFFHLMNYYQWPVTVDSFSIYQRENHRTWGEFEQNIISSQELRSLRFTRFLSAINWENHVNPYEVNETYIRFLIKETTLIQGALPLIQWFHNNIPMGILTNGLKEAQRPRLIKTDLISFFKDIIVSDEVGISKPNPDIFYLAKQKTGNLNPENILLVGDNPITDIKAAQKSGFKTAWFNPSQKELPTDIIPDVMIKKLDDIKLFF